MASLTGAAAQEIGRQAGPTLSANPLDVDRQSSNSSVLRTMSVDRLTPPSNVVPKAEIAKKVAEQHDAETDDATRPLEELFAAQKVES
jgi:hypothetical protein